MHGFYVAEMDRAEDEIQQAVPKVSAGKAAKGPSRSAGRIKSSSSRSNRHPQMATTGTGYKNGPDPASSYDTKKVILALGLLLAIISTVAIILSVGGTFDPASQKSIKQFSGRLQMEKLDGEFITWSDDYQNFGSEKFKELSEKLSSKLIESFEEEGILIDEVLIDDLTPTEPKTITTTHPVDKTPFEKPQGFGSNDGSQFMRSSATQDFSKVAVKTVQHTGVQFVSIKFTTKAKPMKNAAVVMASNGRWPEVSNVVTLRMASKGIGLNMDWTVEKTFLDGVQKAVEANPSLINAPSPPDPPVRLCDCKTRGLDFDSPQVTCGCEKPCTDVVKTVYGGKDNEFCDITIVCLAAFYAGIISDAGGLVHVLKIMDGSTMGDEEKEGIHSLPIKFITKKFLIKTMGTVIRPPPEPTRAPEDITSLTLVLFNIDVVVRGTSDFKRIKYSPEMADLESTEAKEVIEKTKPELLKAMASYRMSDISLTPVATIDFTSRKGGVAITFEARGENVQAVFDAESKDPGQLPRLISTQMLAISVVNFRYSRDCIDKMNELRKKGDS